MSKGAIKMENKSEEQFIIMIKYYKQDSDEKLTKLSEDFKKNGCSTLRSD